LTTEPQRVWTDADFGEMSWHDNAVHGLEIRSGLHGSGELLLDIDYIVEWLCEADGSCQFRLAPATLAFQEVYELKLDVDYAAATASVTPFSIAHIERQQHAIAGSPLWQWVIALSWPRGSITFQARGFRQSLRGSPVVKREQCLEANERVP
jgi:hypothetical protein